VSGREEGLVSKDSGDVYTITDAQRGLSVEQSGRTRRYLISMGIRTACVLLAIFVPGWPRWVFITGAVVLPYLAVVIANAGRENDDPGETGVSHQDSRALGMATTALPAPEGPIYRAP
jgi:type III secretory pathway component EscV